MRIVLVIAMAFSLNLLSNGQITVDADFENGRLDSAYVANGELVVAPVSNLHFRLLNGNGKKPVFKVFDEVGYQLRPYHYMVYRYEGTKEWYFFDTASKSNTDNYYHFGNSTSFTKDTVYVAYWFPYTYTDLQNYLVSIADNPFIINAGVKGYSYEGFTNYLLFGSDTIVDFLRKNFRFFVYPMLNPDGVFNGSAQNALGQGLNREWADNLSSGGTPEVDSIRPVIWNETDQRVDWSVDLHSNAGSNISYYWWGYTLESDVPESQKDMSGRFVSFVNQNDRDSNGDVGLFQNYIQGNGASDSNTAANWFRKTFGAISYTMELTSEPFGAQGDNRVSVERIKQAGASLAKSFYQVRSVTASLLLLEDDLKIFPVPADNILHVQTWDESTLRFVIFDQLGQVVLCGRIASSGIINVGSLEPGIYILKIDNKRHQIQRKLIIE